MSRSDQSGDPAHGESLRQPTDILLCRSEYGSSTGESQTTVSANPTDHHARLVLSRSLVRQGAANDRNSDRTLPAANAYDTASIVGSTREFVLSNAASPWN